jgi:hypothetical protein
MQNTSTFANFKFILLFAACLSILLMFAACRIDEQLTTCDGQGKVEVAQETTGQELADALMAQWTRDHPDRDWMTKEKIAHELKPPADNSSLLKGEQAEGNIYGQPTQLDLLMWTRETEKFVLEGSRIFHNADLLKI